ncbi:MAG: response regulator [Bacteroidales bacterium]|nr:response regulator [Bacteroidales bacterium]
MGKKPKDPLEIKVNWRYRTILIVDNVQDNFEILKAALAPTHAKIEYARSGLEGMRKCIESKRIDVVLLDVDLPDIKALDAARNLKLIREDVVIIGQSVFLATASRSECLASGMDEFFIKPINPNELIALIRAALIKRDKRV